MRRPLVSGRGSGVAALPLFLLLCCIVLHTTVAARYRERLQQTRLLDGHSVATELRFGMEEEAKEAQDGEWPLHNHYVVVPKALAQMVEASNASQLSFHLASGAWDVERWGLLLGGDGDAGDSGDDGDDSRLFVVPPPGLRLVATFPNSRDEAAAVTSFRRLANSLSGVTGAAAELLGAAGLAAQATVVVEALAAASGGGHEVTGYVPNEAPCLDNLAVLSRLLPCGARAGE